MFERRETLPLLTKRVAGGNSVAALSRVTAGHALLAGIVFGVVLGMFVSMTLFQWVLPTENPNADKPKTVAEMLPSIKDVEERHEAEPLWARVPGEKQEQEGIGEVDPNEWQEEQTDLSEQGSNDIELRLQEGSRELSLFELTGGWRFTPEILDISSHYPGHEVVSESEPRIILFHKFLSDEEISHVLNNSMSHLARSQVIGGKDGTVDNIRTSYGAWLTDKYRDETVKEIETRIHNAVGIPKEFGEGIYVLRYEQDQKYNPHTDNCARAGEHVKDSCLTFLKRSGGPECGEGRGGAACGDRIATFIMYLRSPSLGGETVFPQAKKTTDNLRKENRKSLNSDFSENCRNPLYFKIQPSPGDAVLFWDYVPRVDIEDHASFVRSGSWAEANATTEARNDNTALHGGCPVLEGEKWIATKWIRSARFH